jgi:hypothetical protein
VPEGPPLPPAGPASSAPVPTGVPPVPPPVGLLPSAVPPVEGDEPEAPVRVRSRCDEEGAIGLTADGEVVRCRRGRDGDLRWRLE